MQAPDHRRKWDVEEYERLAAKRLAEEEGILKDDDEEKRGKKRELLKQRDYKVDLDSRLGKSIVITKNTPASASGGYYCNVCDCVVKDSINFLDHINGKKRKCFNSMKNSKLASIPQIGIESVSDLVLLIDIQY